MFIYAGTMAAVRFTTKLHFLQPSKQSSSFLLLFHVKEAGERNITTATKRGERQLATEL